MQYDTPEVLLLNIGFSKWRMKTFRVVSILFGKELHLEDYYGNLPAIEVSRYSLHFKLGLYDVEIPTDND